MKIAAHEEYTFLIDAQAHGLDDIDPLLSIEARSDDSSN
jgi:hypothetical protein